MNNRDPKRRRKRKGGQNVFLKIMAENIPKPKEENR